MQTAANSSILPRNGRKTRKKVSVKRLLELPHRVKSSKAISLLFSRVLAICQVNDNKWRRAWISHDSRSKLGKKRTKGCQRRIRIFECVAPLCRSPQKFWRNAPAVIAIVTVFILLVLVLVLLHLVVVIFVGIVWVVLYKAQRCAYYCVEMRRDFFRAAQHE